MWAFERGCGGVTGQVVYTVNSVCAGEGTVWRKLPGKVWVREEQPWLHHVQALPPVSPGALSSKLGWAGLGRTARPLISRWSGLPQPEHLLS